jgi:hypothetical protein
MERALAAADRHKIAQYRDEAEQAARKFLASTKA